MEDQAKHNTAPHGGAQRSAAQWQQIRLECDRRSNVVTNLLEDHHNERQYYLNGQRLSLEESLKVFQHSKTGFFHGYLGSGPSQLALAICLKLYPLQVAKMVYHFFKEDYIAAIPKEKEQFAVAFNVPLDPLTYWNIVPLPDWTYNDEALVPTKAVADAEEMLKNTQMKVKSERPGRSEGLRTLSEETLKQEHDRAYQQAILLPGSIRYDFIGLNKVASFCYIRIVNDYQGKVLVIATDPGDWWQDSSQHSSGSSITNAAEQVATQVCQEFAIPFEKLDWIERYVRTCSIYQYKRNGVWDFQETWDRVTFKQQNKGLYCPDWKPLQQVEIEYLKSIINV